MNIFNEFIKNAIDSGETDSLLVKIRVDIQEYVEEDAERALNAMKTILYSNKLSNDEKYEKFIQEYECCEMVFTLKKP